MQSSPAESSSLALNLRVDGLYGRFFYKDENSNPPFATMEIYSQNGFDMLKKSISPTITEETRFNSSSGSVENAESKVRIFSEVHGVFANVSKKYAQHLDNHIVKCSKNCERCGYCVEPSYFSKRFAVEVLSSVSDEPGFWHGVSPYAWHWNVYSSFYKMSKGNLYLLEDFEFGNQLSSRWLWVQRHFGSNAKNKLIFISNANRKLLPTSKKDILVDCNLKNVEMWLNAGGSAFYWPELFWDCPNSGQIIAKRLILLRNAVEALDDAKHI